MRQNEWLISGIVVCGLLQPMTVSAESASVPAWAYESLQQLVDEGYADMPAKDIRSCSREELAQLTAQAMKNMERNQREKISKGDGKSDLKNLSDEIRWAPSQTVNDSPAYERAERQAKRDTEMLVRYSILGNNQMDEMKVLKKKEMVSKGKLQSVARDYALNHLGVIQGKEQNIDSGNQAKRIAAYSRGASMVVNDEVQVRFAQEQEKNIRREYLQSKIEADKFDRKLAKCSGTDEKGKLDREALSVKALAAHEHSQKLSKALIQARLRTLYWKQNYSYTLARQQGLISDAASTSDTTTDKDLKKMDASAIASKLRAEFVDELAADGYIDDEAAELQLYSNTSIEKVPINRWHVNGEARIDFGHSTGEESIGDRMRIRAMLYPDYTIDDHWHFKSVIEAIKVLSGQGGKDDGNAALKRYYLEGNIGVLKADIGYFSSAMAEGNVYDSGFKGIRLSTGTPIRYQMEFGTLSDIHRAYNFTASYNENGGGWDAGYYNFSQINGTQRSIYMGNWRKQMGDFNFGAMLLYGRDSVAGNGSGYVLTLSHGREIDDWRARNVAYWLKYYHQPSATYVEHTMNGMADYMNYDATPSGYMPRGGFRGWGMGYEYTLRENLVVGLQYYSLRDLDTHKISNTIWSFLSFYFGDD